MFPQYRKLNSDNLLATKSRKVAVYGDHHESGRQEVFNLMSQQYLVQLGACTRMIK